jgi:signal transduction histidine kinase
MASDAHLLRSFRLVVVVRVVLIVVTALLLAVLLPGPRHATSLLLGLLLAGQAWSLVRYVEATTRHVDQALACIENADLSLRPIGLPAGPAFVELQARLDGVLHRFRELRLSREAHLQSLLAVVRHIGIGVISFAADGTVDLLNPAAKALLGIPGLRKVDDLALANPLLFSRLRALTPGQRDLVAVTVDGEHRQLSLFVTELHQQSRSQTLVTLQNIGPELNEKEIEAWQNLIRVLTHEIRNSLTPISSLAASVEQLTTSGDDAGAATMATGKREKIREALRIIQRRSQGLLQFVDTYRDLAHLPSPDLQVCKVRDLFDELERLIAPQLTDRPVSLRTSIVPESLGLTADPKLIGQVLLNLTLNAIDATAECDQAEIVLAALIDQQGRRLIQVSDNGHGIVAESVDKVFIPFYSTKPNGTGIGLSLSRQIMRLHGGDITVISEPGAGATFTLRFTHLQALSQA